MESSLAFAGYAMFFLILAGYFGQKYLPPSPPKLMGIDLGTTYSCAGYYQSGKGKSPANYFLVKAQREKVCIPSVVAFPMNGSPMVGYDALDSNCNTADIIYDAKRFIGRNMSHSQFESEAKLYPFQLHRSNAGEVTFILSNGTSITPVQVGSLILAYLRNAVEKEVRRSIKSCVLSVPAEFEDKQRTLTSECASLAGMKVMRVISEPTAAALAYGLHHVSTGCIIYVMVIDVGGGTTDVALLRVENGMFITQAMAGNKRLGGQDFNRNLLNLVLTKLNNLSINLNDIDLKELSSNVEDCKVQLSVNNYCSLKYKNSSIMISRNEFEDINENLFVKIIEVLNVVLDFVEFRPADINEVVLVGGSTRIPKIRQLVKEYFNGRSPNFNIDPDTTVTLGLAIQAGILGGMWPLTVSATEIMSSVRKVELSN